MGVGFGSSAGKLNNPSTHQRHARAKNYSIPSIPSRFLTPVLNLDINKNQSPGKTERKQPARKAAEGKTGETVTETFLSASVQKLEEDGRAVGPGAYDVQKTDAYMHQPRGIAKIEETRDLNKPMKQGRLNRNWGPGYYEINQLVERFEGKTGQSVPRAHLRRQAYRTATEAKKKQKNKRGHGHSVSIRADFEEPDSDDSYESAGEGRGPGTYHRARQHSTFTD